LSTTSRCSSSQATAKGAAAASSAGLRRLDRRAHRHPLAAREGVALRAGDAVDGDRAGVDQPLRRGPRAGVAARKTSSRSPDASAGTVSSSAIGGGRGAASPRGGAERLEHVDQRHDADRDGDVGDVEGGPRGSLTKSVT
jgi:hypothetical protein